MPTPNLKIARTPVEDALIEAFKTQSGTGEAKGWAQDMRAAAAEIFADLGLPHRRLETWKWTDIRQSLQDVLPLASPASATPMDLDGIDADRAVFFNGHFDASQSRLPDGVELSRTADLLNGEREGLASRIGELGDIGEQSPMSLNTAFMTDGVVLRIPAGVELSRPLHVAHVFTGDPAAVYARNVVVLEDGASAEVVETFEGPAGIAYSANHVTEAHIGENATLRHRSLQAEGAGAVHLNALLVTLAGHASLDHFVLQVGGKVARHQIGVRITGEYADLKLAGVSLLRDRQHADVSLVVQHAAPHGVSRETFATVLEDRSRGVFQGKIVVPPKSQKVDGQMMSRALFLSDAAEFDAKPELEIYADDVLCAHGATCGQIDADHLFYLMARGIPQKEAESLLVAGFIEEAIEAVENEDLRAVFSARAEAWLSERGSA